MNMLKHAIRESLHKLNVDVVHYSTLQDLKKQSASANAIALLKTLPTEHAGLLLKHLDRSKSQLHQDLFVLSALEFRKKGYFVEFGATNGISLSNTHLLEQDFGWTGILAEPGKCWHESLSKNRTAHVEHSCVWKDSRSQLEFNEVADAELSTIASYSANDFHFKSRRRGRAYTVKTISLTDLLDKYNAPTAIDYLSIDTEGSELDILSAFDFEKYTFEVITCEHNFTPEREKIFNLLSKHCYQRVHQALSQFDDWYIRSRK